MILCAFWNGYLHSIHLSYSPLNFLCEKVDISLQSSSKFNTLCFNGYFQYSRNEMFLFFWWMSFVLFVNKLFYFTITCFVCQMNCLFYKCCLIRLMFIDFVDDLYFWRFPCSIEIIILLEIEATYHIYYDESTQ